MLKVKTLFRQLALMAYRMGVRFTAKYIVLILSNVRQVINSGSLGVVDSKNTTPILIKHKGCKFRFSANSISTVREIYLNDCYQFDMKRCYATVLDLGANAGVFTVLSSKRAEFVFSVECNKSGIAEEYARHMTLNNVDNCMFINKFISNKSGVDRISVNTIVSEYSVSELSFIKIDIEGVEKDLFATDLEWLRITNMISMEVHPCFGVDERWLMAVLRNYGFHTILLSKNMRKISNLPANGIGYIRAARI